MADKRIQYNEEMVGGNHPTKADTMNRLSLVEHNNDGTHGTIGDLIAKGPWVDARAFGATVNETSIQSAIDYANAKAGGTQTRSVVTVYIPDGDHQLASQVTVKPHVNIFCEGVLHNNLANKWQPALVFKAGSHCGKIQLYGNLGSGVVFGELAQYSNMQIGDVRLWNIGEEYDAVKGSKKGVKFTGYNFTFDSIDCDGGNIGVDFETASDVRGNKILSFSASTACRITSACEHIHVGHLMCDTPSNIGLQMDSSHDMSLPDVAVFLNDAEFQAALANAVVIGEYSASDKVNNLRLGLRVQNTGGQALKLFNIKDSRIDLVATNATLATGNGHPVTAGIEFSTGVEATTMLNATIDGLASLITGTGGCVTYTQSGALKYRGSAGTVTTLGGA